MWQAQRLDVGVPRVPSDVISRPRLLTILDRGAPLTVVRGACGGGKTVVLHDWVRHADGDVVWITADPGSGDSGELARTVLQRMEATGLGDRGYGYRGWRAVRDRLEAQDRTMTIVLDDAASLERDALVELCETVAAVPRLRVIAAANRSTVLDSDGIALLVDRSVVGPKELLFDEEEIRRALGVHSQLAREILAATNGYPAVIHAMARRKVTDDDPSLLKVAVEAVEEFMRIRVARSGYDPALISTLLRVSFADGVDVQLARALGGDARAEHFLDRAESYGFGEWTWGDSGRMFHFAPFARELLRRELERRHPMELPALRRAVVEWVLRRGRPSDALRMAVEGDDLALARHVVMSSWYELVDHGRSVRGILGAIPLSRLREEPLLVMLLAICYNGVRVRRLRGLQLFRVAASAANSQRFQLEAADKLFTWVAESVALRVLGLHERAAGIAVRALRMIADTSDEEMEPYATQVPLLSTQLGMSLYYGGNERQAIECFSYGAAVAAGVAYEHALGNLSMLSGIHALNGDLPEARHYVELIREGPWGRRELDGYRGTFYRVAEAVLALEDGDAEGASAHVAAFEPHRATSEHWIAMVTVDALVALRLGRAAMGATRLESLAQFRGREGHGAPARRALSRIRSILHLAQGAPGAAKGVLQKDAPEDRFETMVERARIALVDDRPRDTLRILNQTRVRPGTARLRAEAAALRTAALLRSVGEAAARQEAQGLGALLCDRGLRLPLAFLPPADESAVREILRETASCTIEPVESVLPPSAGTPSLTERELVVLRALTSGKPLTAIAIDLGVSSNTVKTQVKSIYRKLGVAGREGAVAEAVARHLLVDHG